MARRWKVLLVTAVAVFMAFLDVTIVNIAFPDLRADFASSSLGGLSWVLNAYNIVFAALLVPAGRLADRIGRRRMFFAGLGLFLAASAACGLAPSVAGPRRGARRAGRRRRRAHPDVARAAAARVPARAARDRHRPLGRDRRRRGGDRAVARRPARGRARAGARSSSSTSCSGRSRSCPARRLLRETRDPGARPAPRRGRRRAARRRRRPAVAGHRQGARLGLGVGGACSARSAAAASAARRAVDPLRRVASPVVDPSLFAVRSFAVANVGCSALQRSASTRCCWATCCS